MMDESHSLRQPSPSARNARGFGWQAPSRERHRRLSTVARSAEVDAHQLRQYTKSWHPRARSLHGRPPATKKTDLTRCVPNGTSVDTRGCQDRPREIAMPKSEVVSAARPREGRRRPAILPNAVEGQIAEICSDLAVQVKRMRQLQEQADALRVEIREWAAGQPEPTSSDRPASREGRR